MKIFINNHDGGIIQQTDKPIINVFNQNKEKSRSYQDIAEDAEAEAVEPTESMPVVTESAEEETNDDVHVRKTPCFKFENDFVKEHVKAVVKDFYLGSPVNLALIEIVLYDHGQLNKRSQHTAFLNELKEWGILPKGLDVKNTANGMSVKMRTLPKKSYNDWNNDYYDDRQKCISIGKKLPDTMGYGR